MRKILLLLIIVGLVIVARDYIKKYDQMTPASDSMINDKSESVGGYAVSWDKNFIYLYVSDNIEKKIKLTPRTSFLRTYIKSNKSLVRQEKISINDLIKDQYIEIDGFENNDTLEALVVRQIIYLDGDNE